MFQQTACTCHLNVAIVNLKLQLHKEISLVAIAKINHMPVAKNWDPFLAYFLFDYCVNLLME